MQKRLCPYLQITHNIFLINFFKRNVTFVFTHKNFGVSTEHIILIKPTLIQSIFLNAGWFKLTQHYQANNNEVNLLTIKYFLSLRWMCWRIQLNPCPHTTVIQDHKFNVQSGIIKQTRNDLRRFNYVSSV